MISLNVHEEFGVKWLSVTGKIDGATSKPIQKELDALIEAQEEFIVADLSEVDYVSSAGLRSFIIAQTKIKQQGGEIVLLITSPNVIDVLESCLFEELFTIFESRAEVETALLSKNS